MDKPALKPAEIGVLHKDSQHYKTEEDDYVKTIKQLESTIGEMFTTIKSLEEPSSANQSDLPKSDQTSAENALEVSDSSLSSGKLCPESRNSLEELNIEQVDDRIGNIPNIKRDVLRLSLTCNRPGTPTRHTPSVYSEADSGIGVSSPCRKYDFLRQPSWTRSILEEDLAKKPDDDHFVRTKSNRSFVYENGKLVASPTLRLNKSFNGDDLGRTSLEADRVSLRSFVVPMGHTDGKRVIYKTDAVPSVLHAPSFETYRGSFQRSTTGSFDDYRRPLRAEWSNKAQFILACVGYSVGLGNIWRFPYVCYKSGGGAFLVPYALALVICGIPLMYMELAIGQYTRRGPIGALGKLCPIMKGAGLSSVVISFIMSTYLSVIIAYSLYYFFTSFKPVAPWNTCGNVWNTPECWMPSRLHDYNITRPNISRTPSQEFYENKLLQITAGIEDLGTVRWELAACLVVAWLMVYFSIWKSVKSSGKVLYFTATFPYVIILAFLVKSLTLEGAGDGLQYLFKPNWALLADSHVWVNAAGQVFTSIGLAFGTVVSLASYKKRENKILVDTLAVTIINALTSLLVAVFAFAVIGNIAEEHETSIDSVITDGPGLVFVVYPQAMAKMPASQAWSILFFFMLLCLGLNTQFAVVEVVVTSLQDGFPNWIHKHLICHEVLVCIVCAVSFLVGIPNITQGGIYLFQLVDHYVASISIMYLAFFEVAAIAWGYGTKRLRINVKEMTNERISFYFRFCWCLAAPAFLLSVWVFSLIDYERPTYRNGDYRYPRWAEALGWGITSLSLACIPVYAVYVFLMADGKSFKEKLRTASTPHPVLCETCLENSLKCSCYKEEQTKEMETLLKNNKLPTIVPLCSKNTR